ncbi:hypothetical protein GCM10020367_68410 [Streptomyces sannanensis]|uniref:Phosphatidic acid phosphatase type 2/haloperoxidase domain-containing protein n=1 Tax=Streptomyces sannanensis TaxID=285536 RepID=A0ABP6S385_9ACTN
MDADSRIRPGRTHRGRLRTGRRAATAARPRLSAGVVLLAPAVACGGAAGVAALVPGGVGRAEPVAVTDGTSVDAYRAVTGWVADASTGTGTLLGLATEGVLVVLGLLAVVAGWRALRDRDAVRSVGVLLTVVGACAAYTLSEALKLVVDEERPCRAVQGAVAAAVCPEPGDWSFPSNHATLSVAVATGLAMCRPRWAC